MNIFIYILEGYKVVDKMVKYGVVVFIFFDWWNYKWEVWYVIFYNVVIMYNEGVFIVINLDDVNMGWWFN